jgi:DNA topoisomerase-3
MTVAVLAEKPSVAKDIAKVLGARKRENGFYKGNSYVVTWAVGHLVTLAEPHDINPSWKSWRRENLPMIPATWKLSVLDQTRPQFKIVKNILTSNEIKEIICATDAGREGELIFRYIYEASGCKKAVRRLWISSLTNEAILNGFKSLKQGNEYNLLADAATGRSRADWLVGLNFSRAYSLVQGQSFSVGRVQTPTLAMLVEKELVIRDFKPEKYFEIHGVFTPSHELIKNRSEDEISNYRGTWFESTPETLIEKSQIKKEGDKKSARLPADGITANEIVKRCRNGKAVIESVNAKTKSVPPLLLYDLTELQRHANRLYGFSAKKTLDLAQNLYEGKKLISYPRTDSRYLSKDVISTLGKILKAIVNPYKEHLPIEMDPSRLGSRFVNDSKVTDHHAIIPTAVSPEKVSLSPDEYKIYDLICRRFLSCWLENHIIRTTTVITAINSNTPDSEAVSYIDRFHTSGTSVEQIGWKVLDIRIDKKKNRKKGEQDKDHEQKLPPGLHKDQPLETFDIETIQKQTKPPNRFTDATLLTAMETAGKTLDDKELSDAMKERGLGTPATRAAIIETLVKREFIVRKGKFYTATDKSINLINAVHPHVKSAEMTGDWEHKLKKIEMGQGDLNGFMKEIEDYVTKVIQAVLKNGQQAKNIVQPEPLNLQNFSPKHSISNSGNLETLLKDAFGFDKFRPFQHKICQSVVDEKNVLLVMPTGAGKSLCYQLPGIARGGTTLVVSPLIALMEDQVIKLQEMGFVAERIHSGRTRAISRQVCIEYLDACQKKTCSCSSG